MVKLFIISSLFVIISACGSRELNLGALDLGRYTRNLSESQDHFPAYVSLMTPVAGRTGVVPAEVKYMTQFFADKSVPRQLFLLGQPGTEVDARVYAMALHDKESRIIEIRTDLLDQDQKTQSWTTAEYNRVIEAVLKNNNTDNTVFFVGDFLSQSVSAFFEKYFVIFETNHQTYAQVRLLKKSKKLITPIPLPELVEYATAIEPSSDMVAVLSFAFLQGHSLLDVVKEIIVTQKEEPELELGEHVFAQYQTRNDEKKSNYDIRENILATSKLELSKDRLQEINNKIVIEAGYFIELPKFLKTVEVFQDYTDMFKELSEYLENLRLINEKKGDK